MSNSESKTTAASGGLVQGPSDVVVDGAVDDVHAAAVSSKATDVAVFHLILRIMTPDRLLRFPARRTDQQIWADNEHFRRCARSALRVRDLVVCPHLDLVWGHIGTSCLIKCFSER